MSDEMFEDEYIELAQGRAYWQARAEAAERRVAELEARLIDVDMAQISTANELEAIAASLGLTYDAWPGFAPILQDIEERLADQEWRPVTEPPGKADWRSGFLVDTKNGIVYYADEYDKGAWLWGDGYMKEIEAVTHWRFLPTSQNKTQG